HGRARVGFRVTGGGLVVVVITAVVAVVAAVTAVVVVDEAGPVARPDLVVGVDVGRPGRAGSGGVVVGVEPAVPLQVVPGDRVVRRPVRDVDAVPAVPRHLVVAHLHLAAVVEHDAVPA